MNLKTLILGIFLTLIMTSTVFAQDILSPPSTYIEQMQEWARTKDASELFIQLAPLYYKVSVEKGVDPSVTYTQSAKETNFLKFGNVVSVDFFNTCGLKITSGGDNNDPNAHKKFSSWEEGIQAQVEHLALYAGVFTPNAKDPRHFEVIKGVAKTVEALGGRWAPSKSYGEEIIKYMNELWDAELQTVQILDLSHLMITGNVEVKNDTITLPKNALVPLKEVCKFLGVQYFWLGDKREIHIPSHNVVISMDTKLYTVDGAVKKFPYAPVIVDGCAMVPVKAFSELFGKNVRAYAILEDVTYDIDTPIKFKNIILENN